MTLEWLKNFFLILTIGSIGSAFLIKQEREPSLIGLTSYEPYLF